MQSKHYIAIRRFANALAESTHSNITRTICRRLFAQANAAVEVSDFDGTLRLQLDLAEHMQRRIFWMGHYSRDVVATLKALLRPGMQFIDIGANIGEISLVAGKIVGPSGSVTSFEPVDAIAEKLERHLRWNGMDWCRAERQALSDHQGEADIFASTGNNGTKDRHAGLASLHNINPGNQPVQRVRLNTLDAYLQHRSLARLDGIKLDIEGAELACLQGAESTLQRYKPWLIVEVQQQTSAAAGHNQTQILSLLARHGYQFYKTAGRSILPVSANELDAIQNVLCLHREKHAALSIYF